MKKFLCMLLTVSMLFSFITVVSAATAADQAKLIESAAKLDLDGLIAAIENGADPNLKDSQGRTALMEACRPNRPASALEDLAFTIKLLLAAKANPNLQAFYANKQEETPLFALMNADFADSNAKSDTFMGEILTDLCNAKVNLNTPSKNNNSRTAMHIAAIKNKSVAINYMIMHAGNVNIADASGKTPLHYAAGGNCLDAAKMLLSGKASIEVKDKNGRSPLDLAATDEMRYLLKPQ